MTSRLARDPQGRPIVVDHDGRRYRIVGDQVEAGGRGITFTGVPTGRRLKPTPPPGPDGWLVGVYSGHAP